MDEKVVGFWLMDYVIEDRQCESKHFKTNR
jgi:hypothetical protein